MLQAGLPDSLWAEVVNTAAYLSNRCATKCLKGITPFEAWTQRKPYVGFFRRIRSKTIALNKNQRGRKFQPKGDEYLLVGYSEESKAHRLWKPGTKTVIKAQDVKFFERIEFPSKCSTGKAFAAPNTFIEMSHKEACNKDIENEVREDSRERHQENTEDQSMDDTPDNQITELENNESHRGPGRPRIDKTGKPRRPQKIYQCKDDRHPDPGSIPHMLKRDDKEPPADKKILTKRWVFKTKAIQDNEIKKYKAQLVARGNTQEWGIDYEEVFAPVARYETIRTLLAASTNKEMHVHQMDVVSAYVQRELNEEIYME
ncbi:hypothetical protein KM043_014339 [Ampulex compressa]|nr:hypothetical protein KM043_014339 [Ampulex compressa]